MQKKFLNVTPDDVFVGSPLFPSPSASVASRCFRSVSAQRRHCFENASPPNMIELIQRYRATVCFTAPTAYRVMMRAMERRRRSLVVACGLYPRDETLLPAPVYEEWMKRTGKPMLDGIAPPNASYLLTNRFSDHRPGCTGKPVTGYEARIVDKTARKPRAAKLDGWRARPHGLPLSRRRFVRRPMSSTDESDRRQLLAGR